MEVSFDFAQEQHALRNSHGHIHANRDKEERDNWCRLEGVEHSILLRKSILPAVPQPGSLSHTWSSSLLFQHAESVSGRATHRVCPPLTRRHTQ
eukprot:3402252-Rhodomonas_salina.1